MVCWNVFWKETKRQHMRFIVFKSYFRSAKYRILPDLRLDFYPRLQIPLASLASDIGISEKEQKAEPLSLTIQVFVCSLQFLDLF